MKKTMIRVSAAALAASSLIGNAWAGCVSNADMAALKTAAMQQELMVAAFSCHAIDQYNRFVRAHQPELIQSDGRLKAYFMQRDGGKRGEASYHTYKTELANASSLRSLHDDAFCDRAGEDFDMAVNTASLSSVVAEHHWPIETTYHACRLGDQAVLSDSSAEAPPAQTRLADRRDPAPSHRSQGDDDRNTRADMKTPLPHHHLEGDSF